MVARSLAARTLVARTLAARTLAARTLAARTHAAPTPHNPYKSHPACLAHCRASAVAFLLAQHQVRNSNLEQLEPSALLHWLRRRFVQ
jgi:hypothetical protein